jgi:micrococcal nuclease
LAQNAGVVRRCRRYVGRVGPRRAVLWIVVFAVLAAGGGGLLSCGETRERGSSELHPRQRLDGRVVKIVDGDTIHVLIGRRREKIRYIGVDTPETHKPDTPVQCYGRAASAFNARLLAGRRVELRTDAETRDRYGRLLAYVYRRPDGLFVNAELVRRGFATILTIPPNVAHAEEFLRLQRAAREVGRGLWSAC